MVRINWLHLTDLHRGMSAQQSLWSNIQARFFEDLAVMHERCGPWHLLLFSGDLVQKGTEEEFRQLNKTLDRLYMQLRKLGSNPVLLTVPGNHDLQRPLATDPTVKLLTEWSRRKDVQEEFWSDPASPYRRTVSEAFTHYTQWRTTHPFPRLTCTDGLLPGDFSARLNVDGNAIGIVGLNTTFLQLTKGTYEGKLGVHPSQLTSVCGDETEDWFDESAMCILMTHQPPSWLTPNAREYLDGEIAIPGRFGMHLFGHLHGSLSERSSRGGAQVRWSLQGCSLFGLEKWGEHAGNPRLHGYSAGSAELNHTTGYLRHWPRRAHKHQARHWQIVADSSFTLDESGAEGPYPIQLRVQKRSMATQGHSTTLALPITSDTTRAPRQAPPPTDDQTPPNRPDSGLPSPTSRIRPPIHSKPFRDPERFPRWIVRSSARVLRALGLSRYVNSAIHVSNLGVTREIHTGVIHTMRRMAVDAESMMKHEKLLFHYFNDVSNACRNALAKLLRCPPNSLNCCIKVLARGPGAQETDRVATMGRSSPINRPAEMHLASAHLVRANSVWSALLGRSDGVHQWDVFTCFACNDLTAYSEFQCDRDQWWNYYRSNLVFPIRYAKNEMADQYDTFGFLAFDAAVPGAFPGMPDIFPYRTEPSHYHQLVADRAAFHVGALCADTLGMLLYPFYETMLKKEQR